MGTKTFAYGLLAAALALSACGGETGGSGDGGAGGRDGGALADGAPADGGTPADGAPTEDMGGADAGAAAIGPEGGRVVSPEGAQVTVPPGAVAEPTAVTIAPAAGLPDLPAGVVAAGPAFDLGPDGQTFAVPVTVRVPFNGGAGRPALYTLPTGGEWTEVPGARVLGAAIEGEVSHFSAFRAVLVGGHPCDGPLAFAGEEHRMTEGFESGDGIALGDFDGDGVHDVVVAAGTLFLMRGTGGGALAVGVPLLEGGASWVGAGDVDGDGVLDLVVNAYNRTGEVVVLVGRGDGTFVERHRATVGAYPGTLVLADLDGDGDLDVVAGVRDAGEVDVEDGGAVAVLLGAGDGTFAAPVTFPAEKAWSVAVGDLDGDGDGDLVVANNREIAVHLGAGDGTFGAAIPQEIAGGHAWVEVGDFDGDGRDDVAVLSRPRSAVTEGGRVPGEGGEEPPPPPPLPPLGYELEVFLSNGDGTLRATASHPFGDGSQALTVADLDGDGRADIAVVDNGGEAHQNQAVVLVGRGDGTFDSAGPWPLGRNPHGIAVGDLDGDGRLDLVATNASSSTVSVLLNTCP